MQHHGGAKCAAGHWLEVTFDSPEWENSGKYHAVKPQYTPSDYLEAERIASSIFLTLTSVLLLGWILMSPNAVMDCRVLKVQKSSWHAETGQEACQTFHYALVLACKHKLGVASGYFGNRIARVRAAVIAMPRTSPWSSLPCRYYRLTSEYGSHQSLSPSPSHTSTQSPD